MKRIIVLGLALSAPVFSATCTLPKGESIKVGCTYDCDFFYRFRVSMTAWGLGYSTRFVNLQNQPDMMTAMKSVDAILVPGGADIDPKYYLESVTPELKSYTENNLHLAKLTKESKKRDPFEYELLKTYDQDDSFKSLPLLGICRGFQMMSVVQGIPLYLDIKTELGIKNRRNLFDSIELDTTESLMSSEFPSKTIKGFKLHHQGIRVPYYLDHINEFPKTRVTAFSNDGKIAEALEYTHRPALGVQYHPEKSFSAASVPVFKWFLTKACEHKNASQKETK